MLVSFLQTCQGHPLRNLPDGGSVGKKLLGEEGDATRFLEGLCEISFCSHSSPSYNRFTFIDKMKDSGNGARAPLTSLPCTGVRRVQLRHFWCTDVLCVHVCASLCLSEVILCAPSVSQDDRATSHCWLSVGALPSPA